MFFSMEMLCFVRQVSGFSHKGIMDFCFSNFQVQHVHKTLFGLYLYDHRKYQRSVISNIQIPALTQKHQALREYTGRGNIWVLTPVSKKTNKHITYTEYLSHEVIYNWIVLNLCKLPCCSEDTGKSQCIRRVQGNKHFSFTVSTKSILQ